MIVFGRWNDVYFEDIKTTVSSKTISKGFFSILFTSTFFFKNKLYELFVAKQVESCEEKGEHIFEANFKKRLSQADRCVLVMSVAPPLLAIGSDNGRMTNSTTRGNCVAQHRVWGNEPRRHLVPGAHYHVITMTASHLGILTLKDWNARYLVKPGFCSCLLTFGYVIIFCHCCKDCRCFLLWLCCCSAAVFKPHVFFSRDIISVSCPGTVDVEQLGG